MAEPAWLVSVHDVMPETLDRVRQIVASLDANGKRPLTLLVVPGADWSAADLGWLRERQARGDRLAGHGWVHRAGPPRGLYDRLHRRFFSRGVAEHLPLDSAAIEALIGRCYDWFGDQGLEPPQLYVPPAWAMGRISRKRLQALPFSHYEMLSGIYDAGNDRFERVPLVGFEADTRFRVASLRIANAVNRALARFAGRLRVSIHPHDHELLLRKDLESYIGASRECLAYGA